MLNPPRFFLQTQSLPLNLGAPGNRLGLLGVAPAQAAAHLRILQGRLPREGGSAIEVLLTQESAQRLGLTVGTTFSVSVDFQSEESRPVSFEEPLRLVGTFEPLPDEYWQALSLANREQQGSQSNAATRDLFAVKPFGERAATYTALAAVDTLAARLDALCADSSVRKHTLSDYPALVWVYPLDVASITSVDLPAIMAGTEQFAVDTSHDPALLQPPFLQDLSAITPADTQVLEKYRNRLLVEDIPVGAVTVLVLSLVLFFVSTIIELLVERQAETLAILLSRGASQGQVVATLLLQGGAASLLALVCGPPLAFVCACVLGRLTLLPGDQGALDLLRSQSLPLLLNGGWLALVVVAACLLTMAFALVRATSRNILSWRCEASRSRPALFLQRLGLDGITGLLALVGFGFTLLLQRQGILDDRLRLLILAPLTLCEIFCLGAALLFFLMRFFAFLLRRVAHLLQRGRGAALQLAFAHMARAPREPIRMTLLLSIAIACAFFTLTFLASQAGRAQDVASYQVGADFSGTIVQPRETWRPETLRAQTQQYQRLPGAQAATLGYRLTITNSRDEVQATLLAVDPDSFAGAVHWPVSATEQSLPGLLAKLTPRQVNGELPALIDARTWQTLQLSPQSSKIALIVWIGNRELKLTLAPVARVNFIPLPDSKGQGGILLNYQALVAYYRSTLPAGLSEQQLSAALQPLNANIAWIRSAETPSSSSVLRNALRTGPLRLDPLYDREALSEDLSYNPLYATCRCISAIASLCEYACVAQAPIFGEPPALSTGRQYRSV